ncbi:MAG: hypothetical protein ABSF92_07785 [Candidatus Acidiferrales bacterium]|jgi:hypothetical protein
MPQACKTAENAAAALAAELLASLQRERLVPRFVDSYVVAHGRYSIQVHPTQYRDLLELLHREALLAMTARVLQESSAPGPVRKSKASRKRRRGPGAPAFRRNLLTALGREKKWGAGEALDFQSDLRLYEDLVARPADVRRARKAFEVADHPFVDRCAMLLDPSFLEQARVAASRTLNEIEKLASAVTAKFLEARTK